MENGVLTEEVRRVYGENYFLCPRQSPLDAGNIMFSGCMSVRMSRKWCHNLWVWYFINCTTELHQIYDLWQLVKRANRLDLKIRRSRS